MAEFNITQIGWDSHEVYLRNIEFLQECDESLSEEDAEKLARDDWDIHAIAWEDVTNDLTEMMNELRERWLSMLPEWRHLAFKHSTEWHVDGFGLGWTHSNGYLDLEAETGAQLLHQMLPDTENTFTITQTHDHLVIVNSHHDAMGERYEVYPR